MEGIAMGSQRTEQRTDEPLPLNGSAIANKQHTEQRVSRRRFVSASAALAATSLLTGRDALAMAQDTATPTAPGTSLPGATPIASPVATPAATPSLGATPEATPVASGPYLEVTPSTVAFDERFDIFVNGVAPGQRVTITSTLGSAGPGWTATAIYVAPEFSFALGYSYVDPGAMTPVEGSFDAPDTMAFIWAATAPGSPSFYGLSSPGDRETVTITAAVDGVEMGSATVERSIAGDAAAVVDVAEDGIVGRFYAPAGDATEPVPAVIVIGGSEGGLSSYNDLPAALLASHGYAALNLAYWRAPGLPSVFENLPLEYFGTAIRWLQRQPGVDPERIAIYGTSRGGEGALLVGSYHPEIKAVVSNVGSGYVVSAPWATTPTPAWTWRGESLPYLPWETAPSADEIARAEIPVERINGPVLLIGADDDGLWPSSLWSQVALDRLRRHEHPWADQLLRYPGAGHIISVPYQPVAPSLGTFTPGIMFGGDPHSNAIANANSWAAILAMLAARFGP